MILNFYLLANDARIVNDCRVFDASNNYQYCDRKTDLMAWNECDPHEKADQSVIYTADWGRDAKKKKKEKKKSH